MNPLSRKALLMMLLCAVLLSSTMVASSDATKVIRAPSSISKNWIKTSVPGASKKMTFQLYLQAPKKKSLETKMRSIAKNGKEQWLDEESLSSYITPTTANQNKVVKALKAAGIPSSALNWATLKNRVEVTTTVALTEKFLNTKISMWTHDGQKAVPKATKVTIPDSIDAIVYSVGTLTAFGDYETKIQPAKAISEVPANVKLGRRRLGEQDVPAAFERSIDERATSIPSSCSSSGGHNYNFPKCLIDYYSLPTPKKSLSRRNDLGVVGYLAENFSQSDLTTALRSFRPDQPNAAKYQMYLQDLLGAVTDGTNPTGEAALDAQVASGLIYPLQTSYYNIGTKAGQTVGYDTGDIFLTAFETFLNQSAEVRPAVLAVSYGILDEAAMTSTAQAMCDAAQALTALGTTIVFAAGDSGPDSTARAYNPEYPDTSGTCLPLTPSYPSGCPYILSVGATGGYGSAEQPVYYGTPSGLAGTYWNWASGSGFSGIWDAPDWQTSAIANWKGQSGNLFSSATKGQYNANGRAFPDVTTLGIDFPIVINNQAFLEAGTSMSAPVMGAIIALLNDELQNAGGSTVGWANPTFYDNEGAFTDFATGGSFWKCGSSSSNAVNYGFNCTTGWDAATGLGAPIYSQLRSVYGL